MILDRLEDAIGCTPQVRLRSLEQGIPGVEIWAKLEWFNPGGSVKDRAAFAIYEGWDMAERLLEQEGLLAGHSAGANAAAALRVAQELHAAGKTGCVVTMLPDKADRYLQAAPG